MMNLLMEATAAAPRASYSGTLSILFILGFIAAVTIGSIAWYNSKRPLGWEDKERPEIVPDVPKVDLDRR